MTHEYRIVEEKLGEDFNKVLHPLFEDHWEEVARNKELMVLNPDIEKYRMTEKAGKLVCLFAYLGDEIVGYSANIIDNHLHYADLVVAYNDVIFIPKEHRNISLGSTLIKETERVCKEHGAKMMVWHAKENTALSNILPFMGAKVQEIIFSKEL
jgi:GNAT superfamily N-acetyltransferase